MILNTESLPRKSADPLPNESRLVPSGSCYHCGLTLPRDGGYTVDILGQPRRVCCPGCQAVAQAIVNGGFERFYDKRAAKSRNPETQTQPDPNVFEIPEVQSKFIRPIDDDHAEVTLNVDGINCGACMWLIESCIADVPGVESVAVNYSTRRTLVTWKQNEILLQDILAAFRSIGFTAYPYAYGEQASQRQKERDRQIRRIGVSGVLGMQIMMIAVALYFGRSSGIGQSYQYFFQWISMLLAVPIVFYCAQPFLQGAWRSVVYRQPSIDIPVSLAISLAFIASVWATMTGRGDTYFEAVAMFVFLLLSVRYFEFTARERGLDAVSHLYDSLPTLSCRIDKAGLTKIPATQLKPGDQVWVGAGEIIPADSVLLNGTCVVDESVISGESEPISKESNSELIGGSLNLSDPITIRVTRTYDHSVISTIARLAERAQSAKPRFVKLVDRIATWFVLGLVLIAAAVALYCWWYDPGRLLSTVIAVLVIACPCALSLATPAALSASVGTLTRKGIVLLSSDAMEKLTKVTHVAFDKTGTLTTGNLKLEQIQIFNKLNKESALAIAGALETSSSHPIAMALASALDMKPEIDTVPIVQGLTHTAGGGVSGTVAGKQYYFGSHRFINEKTGQSLSTDSTNLKQAQKKITNSVLANDSEILASFYFSDELRPEAKVALNNIMSEGVTVSILSGDRNQVVKQVAAALEVADYQAQLSPQEKLELLNRRQAEGEVVLAVGDGINDAPILAAAAVGVAMGSGADLAQVTGDAVLINNRLSDLNLLLGQAKQTRRIIRQNLTWALGYNLLALPLGVVGLVPPWIAVIGMSLSSLLVVMNALRLSSWRSEKHIDRKDTRTSWAYA